MNAAFAAGASSEPMDINFASEEQLKTVPRIGDAYAKKSIFNRPYKRKDDRRNVGDQVTVEFLRDGHPQQASITLVPIE